MEHPRHTHGAHAMTTDRELLEAAARAAGMGPLIWGEFNPETPLVSGAAIRWNPLTDDGDALRLAVRLAIDLYFHETDVEATAFQADPDENGVYPFGIESAVGDSGAATRRAIVRAAAGITPG